MENLESNNIKKTKYDNQHYRKTITDVAPDVHKAVKSLAAEKELSVGGAVGFLLGYYRSTNPAGKIDPENFERDLEKDQGQEQEISEAV